MSTKSKLQIKELSKAAEVLNCFNCFAGQIAVFRANVDRDLQPLCLALSGSAGAQRFSILLDQEVFKPEENILIGFGEQLVANKTVSEMLTDGGLPGYAVISFLSSYGLENCGNKEREALSDCEKRRVQILLATLSQAKVFILHDPFATISGAWRERFAELLVQDAKTKLRIIVVPRLSFRPEHWIDNPAIARIQIGSNLQKTVGFGGNADDIRSLVDQVRTAVSQSDAKLLEESNQQQIQSPSSLASNNIASVSNNADQSEVEKINSSQSYNHQRKYVLFAGVALVSMLTTAVLVLGFYKSRAQKQVALVKQSQDQKQQSNSSQMVQAPKAAPQENPFAAILQAAQGDLEANNNKDSTQLASNDHKQRSANLFKQRLEELKKTKVVTAPAQAEAVSAQVLDDYPLEIKQAIFDAFDGKVLNIASNPAPTPAKLFALSDSGSSTGNSDSNPFSALLNIPQNPNAVDDSSANESAGQPFAPPAQDDQALKERQEMIRQKFLEAINRAAARRNEDSGD